MEDNVVAEGEFGDTLAFDDLGFFDDTRENSLAGLEVEQWFVDVIEDIEVVAGDVVERIDRIGEL